MRITSLPARAAGAPAPPRPSSAPVDSVLIGQGPPGTTSALPAPVALPASQNASHEEARSLGPRLALAAALGAVAFGGLVAQATPALAAVVQDTRPVQVASVQEAVDRFEVGRQLYVVGQPALNGAPLDVGEFEQVVKDHPHAYVVLVDKTVDVAEDDHVLSRGIGNSPAFQSVVNPVTGEKDAVVVMIYFNVDGDPTARKIFMRSEEMPDRLGVGEQNFADPDTGAPRELLGRFIDGFRSTGSPARGLERVLGHIEATIEAHTDALVESLGRAERDLGSLEQALPQFVARHGPGGALASPPLDTWRSQLAEARASLARGEAEQAASLASEVSSQASAARQALEAYEQAPATADRVSDRLGGLDGEVASLESNGHADAARAELAWARAELESYRQAHQAKDPGYQQHLDRAGQHATRAASEVEASRSETRSTAIMRAVGVSAGVVAVLAVAFIAGRRASHARRDAEEELDRASATISRRSQELLELLETADYHKLQSASGPRVDALMKDVTDALTLVGGAEKFLQEARELVHPEGLGRVKAMFTTGNYRQAEELLTGGKLRFGYGDSARKVMEQGAATWREQLEKQGSALVFEQSLDEVLALLDQKRAAARENLVFLADPPGMAGGAVRQASEGVAAATRTLTEATGQRWEHDASDKPWWKFWGTDVKEEVTPADLAPARKLLAEATKQLETARAAMSAGDYDLAYRQGQEATRLARQADSAGHDGLSKARARFDQAVASVEAAARRAEEERRWREKPVYTPSPRQESWERTEAPRPRPTRREEPRPSATAREEPRPKPKPRPEPREEPRPKPREEPRPKARPREEPRGSSGSRGGSVKGGGGSGSRGGSNRGRGGSGSTGGSW